MRVLRTLFVAGMCTLQVSEATVGGGGLFNGLTIAGTPKPAKNLFEGLSFGPSATAKPRPVTRATSPSRLRGAQANGAFNLSGAPPVAAKAAQSFPGFGPGKARTPVNKSAVPHQQRRNPRSQRVATAPQAVSKPLSDPTNHWVRYKNMDRFVSGVLDAGWIWLKPLEASGRYERVKLSDVRTVEQLRVHSKELKFYSKKIRNATKYEYYRAQNVAETPKGGIKYLLVPVWLRTAPMPEAYTCDQLVAKFRIQRN